jgi:hypothetical protein
MGVLGDLGQYTRLQTAEAIPAAAANPGGIAGIGAGLGAGMAVAGQMAGALQGAQAPAGPATPPPLPTPVVFYIALNGAQAGPFDLETLRARVRDGSLTRATLVWKQGMPNWSPAESVAELQQLFAAMPPPLPPSRPV